MNTLRLGALGLILGGWTTASLAQTAWVANPPVEDAYLRGYVQALLDREPAWTHTRLSIEQGVIVLDAAGLSGEELTRLMQTLSSLRGVQSVRLVQEAGTREQPLPPSPMPMPDATLPTAQASEHRRAVVDPSDAAHSAALPTDKALDRAAGDWQIFPKDRLFDPLVGDPRWPHFGATYARYLGENLKSVPTVSFGETLVLFRREAPDWLGGQWEFVLQPALFAIFDLDAPSADLVNADYTIGGGFAWRDGPWSALVRYYHLSSHLGDEFILHNGITLAQRVNLSYETLQLLVSYQGAEWWRIYGGVGVLVNTDPADLDNTTVQYGLELRAPWRFLEEWATPILALDVKHLEYHDWDGDLSVRAGLELADPRLGRQGSRMLLLFEYYTGRSPHGQFFNESIRYLGMGMHFYY